MKKNQKYLLGVSTVMAGVAVCTSLITRHLMQIALDRKAPKAVDEGRKHIKQSDEMQEFKQRVSVAAGALKSSKSKQVEIVSHDGLQLIGHWSECEEPKRIIIAMHGWRSSWANDFGMIADFWKANNCNVLYVEQRGQNNSAGDYMGFGMLERYDCLDWIKWVNEQNADRLPIYLAGVSMGAATVLMTTELELPETVHGVIADCGFTSPHAIWKHVVENNLHMPYGIHEKAVNNYCKRKIRCGAKDVSAVNAMKKCNIPVLFVHGTDDKLVPVEMTYENYKACKAAKRLLIVPGAEHAMSYFMNREGYEKELKEFWHDFD